MKQHSLESSNWFKKKKQKTKKRLNDAYFPWASSVCVHSVLVKYSSLCACLLVVFPDASYQFIKPRVDPLGCEESVPAGSINTVTSGLKLVLKMYLRPARCRTNCRQSNRFCSWERLRWSSCYSPAAAFLHLNTAWMHITYRFWDWKSLENQQVSRTEDKVHEEDNGWEARMDHLRFCSGSVSRLQGSWGGSRAFERAFSSPSEINVFSSGSRLSAGILETHHRVLHTAIILPAKDWLRSRWRRNTLPDEGQ